MANNSTAKNAAGSTVTFATDDVSSVHYPVVKLAVGTEDAADRISVTAPLPIRSVSTVIKPTIVTDTAIYAALDVIGAAAGSGVVTITGAARESGGTGIIETIALFDDDNEKNPITLLFFDAAPASGTYTGNGALALSAGDKAKYIGRVNIFASDYETLGGDAFVCLRGVGLAFQCSGSANLYMIPLVSSGTPTYTASTDLQMAIGILQD
jgi:hypothetical protein